MKEKLKSSQSVNQMNC